MEWSKRGTRKKNDSCVLSSPREIQSSSSGFQELSRNVLTLIRPLLYGFIDKWQNTESFYIGMVLVLEPVLF